jgi:opacity protein-like surface antigen
MLAKACYLDGRESNPLPMQKDHWTFRKHPRLLLLALMTAFLPGRLDAQFEQQLSVNLSAAYFNTLGWKDYEPDWTSNPEEFPPTLMPNFGSGISAAAGIQYNFSRHLSVEFHVAFMFSNRWYFDFGGEGAAEDNYLYWCIYADTIDWNELECGEHYMDLSNLQLGLAPRYYLLPGRKVNPYVLGGITLNYTDVYFEDTESQAREDLGMLDGYEGYYDLENWFDYHVGIGLKAGAGIEFALSDKLGLFAQVCYDFIPLSASSFLYEAEDSDFHGMNLHLGMRISFLKSKEL